METRLAFLLKSYDRLITINESLGLGRKKRECRIFTMRTSRFYGISVGTSSQGVRTTCKGFVHFALSRRHFDSPASIGRGPIETIG
jgi:hypothetical protein